MIHVHCRVHKLRSVFGEQEISFETDAQVLLIPITPLGPRGLSAVGADLINLSAAVGQIERLLSGRTLNNPPERFKLTMNVHAPQCWTPEAIQAFCRILQLQGNAQWELDLLPVSGQPFSLQVETDAGDEVKQVALFSGGLDSACGAALLLQEVPATRLVSFFTRQKSLQHSLAVELGHVPPIQWRKNYIPESGKGRSFYYRALQFLALAAVSAESWGARIIYQFENGILATAIPPTPAFFMTRHAHPEVHRCAESLFSSLFGGTWQIRNPLLTLTKRAAVEKAISILGGEQASRVLGRTETCWYLVANRYPGGRKPPGLACGVCIPCIVRHTALPDEQTKENLADDQVRNNPRAGQAFRSYYGFLRDVLGTSDSPAAFYRLLPASGRTLVSANYGLTLADLHILFVRFAQEFMAAYNFKY